MMTVAPRQVANAGREHGFSLLEVLVSLVLLAFILTALPGSLRVARRAWDISEGLDRSAADTAALSFIRQRISDATPIYKRQGDGRLRIAFSGQPSVLSFVAPATLGPANGGLYEFELKSPAEDSGVILAWTLYRPDVQIDAAGGAADATSLPPRGERTLFPNASDFSVRYFGAQTPNADATWSSVWGRDDALPDLIEIRMTSHAQTVATPHLLRVELRLRPNE